MKSEDILRSDMLDLIFDGRNKVYGAYDLRRRYPNHVGRAIIITILTLGSLLLYGVIRKKFTNPSDLIERPVVVKLIEFQPIEKKIEKELLPSRIEPPPPAMKTTQHAVSKVVRDNEAPKSDIEHVDNHKDISLGTKNQEGVKYEIPNANINVNPKAILRPESKRFIDEKKEDEHKIFNAVEQMPEFPGGEIEMKRWLANHIIYPSEAAKNNLEGKVYVKFIVEKNGSINNVTIIRDYVGGGAGAESVSVVKKMPNWKSGKQNGKAVRVSLTLPITFRLED